MNVIIANKKKQELNNLKIDIIKSVDGIYTVDELIGIFTNFFFNKMILDISSIKEYDNYTNLKKLFESVDTNKVILLLENNEICNKKEFISDLITLGVYNFTTNVNEIMELYNNPKCYNDVSNLQVQKNAYDINAQIDADLNINQKEDFTFKDYILPGEYDGNKKIIGIVNLTEHAGATTLAVQMVKQLNIKYKALGLEMNKQDFLFFNTPMLYSCMSKEDVLRKIKDHQDTDAIIVDLNNYNPKEFCTDVLYLVEPGTIKINKLINKNGKIFEELSGEKIVLNRTNMDSNNISEFEVETNTKIFITISNFRDNIERVISVDRLLHKMGFTKCLDEDIKKDKISIKKSWLFSKRK